LNIRESLQSVRRRIEKAAQAYDRPLNSIHLLAVSKKKPVKLIQQAYEAGQRCFGENYLQEALPKIHDLQNSEGIEFHFIGDIQSNKTKLIAENFAWVHSVDREKIAQRLNDQRPQSLPPLNVCISVNVSQEVSKSGVNDFTSVYALAEFIKTTCPRLMLRGLMTIPHLTYTFEEQCQPYIMLREMLEKLNTQGLAADTLSMGMSYDLEAAIAEGATIVRVGQAIFGQRNNYHD